MVLHDLWQGINLHEYAEIENRIEVFYHGETIGVHVFSNGFDFKWMVRSHGGMLPIRYIESLGLEEPDDPQSSMTAADTVLRNHEAIVLFFSVIRAVALAEITRDS